MINELQKLRELTETLTGNGYLKDQADEWRDALDAIPDGIYIIDRQFRIKYINKTLSERLGVSQEDAWNKPCFALIHGLSDINLDASWVEKANAAYIEKEYISALDGWFNMTKSPITTKSGKVLGFICVIQDITSELMATKALEEREQTLKALFDSAPIGMGLIDKDTFSFHSVNRYLTELVGYSAKELVGNSSRLLYKTLEDFENVIASIKSMGPKMSATSSVETQLISKFGEMVDVQIRASNIGKRSLLVFTVLDLTEKKRNEKLIALNEERLDATFKLFEMVASSEEEVMCFALEEAVRLTSSKIGYLHFVSKDTSINEGVNLSLFMWSDQVTRDCQATKVLKYPLEIAGCWADCTRDKAPVVHNDYKNYAARKGLPEGHIDLVRHLSVPVVENGEVVAIAGVGNKEHEYDSSDIRQLSIFMNSMWEIVSRKRNK